MEYVRLTMEEYQALVEENKKLKEYLELAIADMTNNRLKELLENEKNADIV